MGKAKDLTGMTFGRLTVVEKAGTNNYGANTWLCSCDCGNRKVVIGHTMTSGGVKSCGCMKSTTPAHNRTHNMSGTSLFRVWASMRNRCNNPGVKSYPDYGGRGIKVCERWDSFENFLADMGERPSPQHSIDRKDNSGDYTPENCHWVTRETQVKNKRNNRHITANGETLTLIEWARKLSCAHGAIITRIKAGMSEEDAVTKPIPKRPNSKLTEAQALEIYALEGKATATSVALKYSVHPTSISNIWSGKNFSDVTGANHDKN